MGGLLAFRDRGVFHKNFSVKKDIGLVLREKQLLCYGPDRFLKLLKFCNYSNFFLF